MFFLEHSVCVWSRAVRHELRNFMVTKRTINIVACVCVCVCVCMQAWAATTRFSWSTRCSIATATIHWYVRSATSARLSASSSVWPWYNSSMSYVLSGSIFDNLCTHLTSSWQKLHASAWSKTVIDEATKITKSVIYVQNVFTSTCSNHSSNVSPTCPLLFQFALELSKIARN